MVVVQDGDARGWVNLRLVHQDQSRLVWMRLRHAARYGLFDVLYASDLPARVGDDRETADL